jgi:hypothetical protein
VQTPIPNFTSTTGYVLFDPTAATAQKQGDKERVLQYGQIADPSVLISPDADDDSHC